MEGEELIYIKTTKDASKQINLKGACQEIMRSWKLLNEVENNLNFKYNCSQIIRTSELFGVSMNVWSG